MSTSHSQQKFSMNWLGSSTASHSTPEMPATPMFVHLGEHVVQAVTELVKQGGHVVMREQCGTAVDGRGKVADEVRHRCLQSTLGARPAAAHIVHPCPRPLAWPGIGIQVELPHQLAGALNAEEAHGRVPHRGHIGLDADFEQRLDNAEQPFEHLGLGEVLLDLLVAERIPALLEPLTHEGHVPSLQLRHTQFVAGELAQFRQVTFSAGARALCQVAEKITHLAGRLGHLGHQ